MAIYVPPVRFHAGMRVTELAFPGRHGTISSVSGSGTFMVLWVLLDGYHGVSMRPYEVGFG